MQGNYPANGGVRLRRVCDDGQSEPRSGRLFLCARCRGQAIVCRCCDRGQIYCGAECARQARQEAQHAAAKRYAASPRGKRRQAGRSRRYRRRQREIITHQGSPPSPAGDLLPADAMVTPRDDASRPSRPGGRWRTVIGAAVPACRCFARGSCAVAVTAAVVLDPPERSAMPHGDPA